VNVARTLTDTASINALGGRINIGRSAYRRLYTVAYDSPSADSNILRSAALCVDPAYDQDGGTLANGVAYYRVDYPRRSSNHRTYVPPASEAVRRTRVPAYVIATLVLLVPLMEIGASAWPYRIHDPQWRISVITAAAGASTAILLGLLIIYVVGTLFDDRPAIWVVALSAMAGGSFVLDALQLKGQVSPASEDRYNVVSALALAKLCLVGVAALAVAVSAFRAGRNLRRASLRRAKKPSSVIVSSSTTAVPGEPVA
jgi:hypothetical protein